MFFSADIFRSALFVEEYLMNNDHLSAKIRCSGLDFYLSWRKNQDFYVSL